LIMAERRNGQPQTHPRPDPVERHEQQMRAVEMKRQGHTFPQIAEELKCGIATAHKLFKQGLATMEPPGMREELAVIRMQLEEQFYEIQQDLLHTNDAAERVKLYTAALANMRERRTLYGGADINVKHTFQDQFSKEMEDLHAAFDEDQKVRDAARGRRQRRG
jgi:hypothetical protein